MKILGHEAHEVAGIFPLLDEFGLAALAEDIRAHGLLHPMVRFEGKVLDGRNRLLACARAKVEPRFVDLADCPSPTTYVISANLKRRQLTPSQAAAAAVEALPFYEKEARDREHAGRPKGGEKPSAKMREDSKGKAASHAARAFGASPRYVESAKVLKAQRPDLFRKVRQGGKDGLTISSAMRMIRREGKVKEVQKAARPLPGDHRYPVIYADPPWRYEFAETDSRKVENQYPTLALAEICKLPVGKVATDDAVLFLWTTAPKLEEAFSILRAWGFSYKTCMAWVKDKIGMGYYCRGRHEIVLIATRGNLPLPEPDRRPSSVVEAPRGRHSEKPEKFYELIERMYPEYPRIELFARTHRPGWEAWGAEAHVS